MCLSGLYEMEELAAFELMSVVFVWNGHIPQELNSFNLLNFNSKTYKHE